MKKFALVFIFLSGRIIISGSNSDSTGQWRLVGKAGFTSGQADSLSLSFNGSSPYLAYSDLSKGKKATLMKFE